MEGGLSSGTVHPFNLFDDLFMKGRLVRPADNKSPIFLGDVLEDGLN